MKFTGKSSLGCVQSLCNVSRDVKPAHTAVIYFHFLETEFRFPVSWYRKLIRVSITFREFMNTFEEIHYFMFCDMFIIFH